MSKLSRRVLAFLSGINDPRPGIARIAAAVHRSERSVKRATVELVENLCIKMGHSGHGRNAEIIVLKTIDEVLALELKMAPESQKVSPERRKMAPESGHIRALVKTLEQEPEQARKPMGVEIPTEYVRDQGGNLHPNPAFIRVRDALIFARERISRAHDPEAYRRAIVQREAARR